MWAQTPGSPSCFDAVTVAAPSISSKLCRKAGRANYLGKTERENPWITTFKKTPSNLLGESCRPTLMPITLWSESVLTNSHTQTRHFDISPQAFCCMPTLRLQNFGSWGAPSTIHSTGGCPKPRPSQSRTCTWFFCC